MKYRCEKGIALAEGSQFFEVEADNEELARELFEAGAGVLVETECEVVDLEEYDLSCIEECQDIANDKAALHEKLKGDALEAIRHAEMTAHIYACSCDLSPERAQAFQIYENIRLATRIN